jgi:hypothetical protein
MKRKKIKKTANEKKAETEIESVIQILKKRELQTEVLKKIIKDNKLTDKKTL